jgi:hypothetical protein
MHFWRKSISAVKIWVSLFNSATYRQDLEATLMNVDLMTSLLFYPGMGLAVLTLAELKSFIIKYDKLKR